MFRLLIAALCLSAASAYSGAAAPAGKTTVFTGSKNAHIYRTATPSQAAPAELKRQLLQPSTPQPKPKTA